jgi:Bacterial type II and III secretion system protein
VSMCANRVSFSALWIVTILATVLPAWADETAGRQVIVETHMLRLDADKLPASIRQLIAQPATQPADPSCLTPEQHQQLLKAVSDTGGEVLASPTLLLRDGTEAEVKALSLRRYLDSVEPQQERGAQGQIMYLPHAQDAESGTTLKVKANISKDGKYISLGLSSRLLKLLELTPYTFEGKKDRLSIQKPRSQEGHIETLVSVPDGQTVVLGGQTTSQKPESQTLLILVRPTIVRGNAQATTRRAARAEPAAIAIQTRVLTISRNFAADIGLPYPIAGNPPCLDDAQAQKLFQAMQAIRPSVVTTPSVTISNGQEAIFQTDNATSYVGTFAVAKSSAGKLTYEPRIESMNDGVRFHVVASAVPGQDAVSISADLVINHLAGMESFTFLDKPAKLTVQQPQWAVLSTNLTAAIPDKHWTVVSSWQVQGTVIRETSVAIPVIGRLLGTNRSEARDTTDTYLLIRPEMLDHMPPATAPSLRDQ